jgi:hypothetical protein
MRLHFVLLQSKLSKIYLMSEKHPAAINSSITFAKIVSGDTAAIEKNIGSNISPTTEAKSNIGNSENKLPLTEQKMDSQEDWPSLEVNTLKLINMY